MTSVVPCPPEPLANASIGSLESSRWVTSGPPHWASHVRFRRVQTWSVRNAQFCFARFPPEADREYWPLPGPLATVTSPPWSELAGDGETQAGSAEALGGSWHRPDSFACRSVVMPMPVSAAAISMPHVRRTGFAP